MARCTQTALPPTRLIFPLFQTRGGRHLIESEGGVETRKRAEIL